MSATSGEPLAPGIEYSSCAQAQEVEAAPLHSGENGYSSILDPDGDGVACDE
ncbi:excalibur calcium-binding domain-containing protein (plasmid) [Rhodococcus qingshengii]